MRFLLIISMVMITSCYFFPFTFTFFPIANTKLMIAAVGIFFFAYHLIKMEGIILSKELGIASVIAIIFSLIGYFSVDYNHTSDYAYSTYIMSMWIWFAASYFVVTLIGTLHGYLSIRLVVNYLIAVCIMQCVLALMINFIPVFKAFVDAYFITGDVQFLDKVKRLYGIGALLDVSGVRFSAVLMMIAVLLCHNDKIRENMLSMVIYAISFIIISIIGNMISRSTSVGMAISVGYYLLFGTDAFKSNMRVQNLKLMQIILVSAALLITITGYFYSTNEDVFKLLRYGFEGFFKWIETGKWETDSTERLKTMWVYPDNIKTWIIGDGYFEDPLDPKYYYMGTDVGYLRFIFYCGLLGLSAFSLFFVYLSHALWLKFSHVKHLFGLLLILTFVNWLKVSTDIFLIYAIFLSVGSPYLYRKFYIESD